MKDEALHPWIEPELEARIVALVLGEASDFERDELERLIEEKAELAMFKKRMQAVHGLLREVTAGESLEDTKNWKLSDDRRAAVLSVIGGKARERSAENVVKKLVVEPKQKRRKFFRHLIEIAAILLVVGFIASMSMPAFNAVKPRSKALAKMHKARLESYEKRLKEEEIDAQMGEATKFASRSLSSVGSASTDSASSSPISSAAAVVEPDPKTDSLAALSSIRQSLQGQKAKSDAVGRVLSSPDNTLFTTTYKVPPSFIADAAIERAEMDAVGDPFAEPEGEASTLARRNTTKNILVDAGVTFAPGASVIYNPETSELIVRNTQDQLELVEAYKDSIKGKSEALSFPDTNDTANVMSSNSVDGFQLAATTASSPPFADDASAPVKNKKYTLDGHGGTVTSSLDVADDNFMDGKADKQSPHLGHGQTTPVTVLGENIDIPQSAPLYASAGGSGTMTGVTRGSYANAARNQTRADFLRQEAAGWELPVPSRIRGGVEIGPNKPTKRESNAKAKVQSQGSTYAQSKNNAGALRSAGSPTMEGRVKLLKKRKQLNTDTAAAGKVWETPKTGGKIDKNPARYKSAQREWQHYPNHPATTAPNPALNSAPKVTARSGGRAVVEYQREFITPKDYDPAEIPSQKTKASDQWYKAFVLMKEGERLAKSQSSVAQVKFAKSKEIFDSIAQDHPEFHSSIVNYRRRELGEKLAANKQTMDKIHRLTPEVVGGGRHSGKLAETEKIKITAGDPIILKTKKAKKNLSAKPSAPNPIQIKKSPVPNGLNEKSAASEAFSTFSLHVSDVSFKLAQAALAKGEWPEASKVRIEEFVNAFDYGDAMPNADEKVACRLEQGIHPFLQQRNLLRVSMRTAAAGRSSQTPLRLTFLLDNSGSMERSDRQQTVRRAFALLAAQLKPMDQVTLISFARQPRLLADQVSGAKANQLVKLIANLPSEGGTNLEAALQLAFEKAQEQQLDRAQNRIIMLTDGAANLGDADPERLSQMIEKMRDSGIAFDAAGIGADGLNDEILEALTRKGDGRYYLLDRPEDADEGFSRQIAGALRPAAKNVKVQIEFNPKRVGRYKLLGFEKHRLKKEDFRNDQVDAAEMAAAEAGVAIYQFEAKPDGEGDVGSVSVRFRDLSTGLMIENRWPIPYQADAPRLDQAAASLRIASTAALFAAKLKGGPLGNNVDLKTLSQLISGLPPRQLSNKKVQQLQQMINAARASSR